MVASRLASVAVGLADCRLEVHRGPRLSCPPTSSPARCHERHGLRVDHRKATPAHKLGRLWKFQASEVGEWVLSGGVASSGEDAWPD
jgi:hypothetical protein